MSDLAAETRQLLDAADDRQRIADAPKCGHHGSVLTDIPDHGLRCPWCFPEFFPEHRFLVAFGEAQRLLDAAGYDVVLRDTPDTGDELAAETRRLLDAATELTAEWYIERTYNKHVPDHWSVDVISDDDHVCSVRGGDEGAHALAALIAAAPRLLANWLAREDTDVLSVYPDLVLQLRSLSDRSCNAAADIIEQLAAERDEAERRERVAIDITKNMEAILMILLDREGGSTVITDAEVVAVDRRRHIESYRTDLDWNITVRVAAADRGVTDRNPT